MRRWPREKFVKITVSRGWPATARVNGSEKPHDDKPTYQAVVMRTSRAIAIYFVSVRSVLHGYSLSAKRCGRSANCSVGRVRP
jgi:hypothetical protein